MMMGPGEHHCTGLVPIISEALARRVLRPDAFTQQQRHALLQASLTWLTARHPDVQHYLGIRSRAYTNAEKDAIALDMWAASATPCPYQAGDGSCMFGARGFGSEYNRVAETGKMPYLFMPMAVAKYWALDGVRELISMGYVADAKVAALTGNDPSTFPIESQRVGSH